MTVIEDKWREGRMRPLQGNAPPDRPVSRVFASFQERLRPRLLRHFPAANNHTRVPRYAFIKAWRNLSVRCGLQSQTRNRTLPPPASSIRPRAKERAGRITLFSSSAMSSGRLFLDRVGRHQSPSPLHRHTQTNTHLQSPEYKHDISTLPGGRHFYFALTARGAPMPFTHCPLLCPRLFHRRYRLRLDFQDVRHRFRKRQGCQTRAFPRWRHPPVPPIAAEEPTLPEWASRQRWSL
jgi:hypothetical protein